MNIYRAFNTRTSMYGASDICTNICRASNICINIYRASNIRMHICAASNICMNIYGTFLEYHSYAFMIYGSHYLMSWISTPALPEAQNWKDLNCSL